MSLFFADGSENHNLSPKQIKTGLFRAFDAIGARRKVLAIPPDFTRFHSRAGLLTSLTSEYYREALACVLPALGTHVPMTEGQIVKMFPDVPPNIFAVHDWRNGVREVGEVPESVVRKESEEKLHHAFPIHLNRQLLDQDFDLILSIGQVVPHEVAGMAGHNKNVIVGVGGAPNIHNTHFLGAVHGMERIMGRADNPVRRVLNYAADTFACYLPLVHVLTVVSSLPDGSLVTRGLFIGDDGESYERAAELSLKVNLTMVDKPLRKVVVYLDPQEFQSTWLGNKSIYRTRMAIADGGELIVLAPGVKHFGEDRAIDCLIRKFGYFGTATTLAAVERHSDLASNLSAAAHLIHGSSEGRFSITYCPGNLSPEEVEGVGFRYASLGEMLESYDPENLRDGLNVRNGEEFFYISNPGLGLWAYRDRFQM
jgi:nickel-dependent lactate racemase